MAKLTIKEEYCEICGTQADSLEACRFCGKLGCEECLQLPCGNGHKEPEDQLDEEYVEELRWVQRQNRLNH